MRKQTREFAQPQGKHTSEKRPFSTPRPRKEYEPRSLLLVDTGPATDHSPIEAAPVKPAIPADIISPDKESNEPLFILHKDGESFNAALDSLILWVNHLLLPVYGREVSSQSPWCPRWWLHMEAVAQLHGLWMAWQALTCSKAPSTGPASWHRDFLAPVMTALKDPSGPFADCETGGHHAEEPSQIESQ
ncbi:DUF4913 domain-containing protein [Streptomyces sp. NPDC055210]